MKYYTFFRETNNFDDIIKDVNLKKVIDELTIWHQHITVGIDDAKADTLVSYITLKFGDSLRNELVKDLSPIPYIDYIPKKS